MRDRLPSCAKVPLARGGENHVAGPGAQGELCDLRKRVGVVALRGQCVRIAVRKVLARADAEWIAGERTVGVAPVRRDDVRRAARSGAHLAGVGREREEHEVARRPLEQAIREPVPLRRECRPPGALPGGFGARGAKVHMRHRVAAHHHGGVAAAEEHERMCAHTQLPGTEQLGEIVVRRHTRVAVIAHDPEVHRVPSAGALRVGANACCGVVDNPQCLQHQRMRVSHRVRELVRAQQRAERECRLFITDARHHAIGNVPVDGEPAAQVAAKMGPGGAHAKWNGVSEPVAGLKPAPDHGHRRNGVRYEFKDGGRARVEIAVCLSHLAPHVAARQVRKPRVCMRAVVPAQAGQSHGAGIATHQERCVRGPGDRGKHAGHGVHAALGAQPRERREFTAVHCTGQRVGTRAIGDEHHHTRALCARPVARSHAGK